MTRLIETLFQGIGEGGFASTREPGEPQHSRLLSLGGGASLTPAGHELLRAAEALATARHEVLARFGAAGAGSATGGPGLAALALRTSLRNQWPATVGRLTARAGATQVALTLPGGAVLAARITRDSAQMLGLRPGLAVLALCKATAVQVTRPTPAPARENHLPGRIVSASRAAAGGEAVLALDGGPHLVGFAGAGLGLRAGAPAVALIDPAAVVVALPA